MARYTQEDRLFKVFTPLEDDLLLLDYFAGAESMSAPFRFSLRLFSEKPNLQLKDLMGQPVTVHLGTFNEDRRFFNGYVVSFTHAGSDGDLTFYDMQLGPWLDFLRRRMNCRIFQEMKVEDILRKVFADYGALAKHDIRATSKDVLTMCVQYNETDFQFVSRLMEGLGWFYYFDHDDGEHTLIIDKDSPSLSPIPQQPEIEFNDSPGAEAKDAIDRFESFRILVPNKLGLKTFDFKNPEDALKADTKTKHNMGKLPDLEWYEHHGPYTYKEPTEGEDLAELLLEEPEARSKGFRGSGNCRALTSGHTFTLYHHYVYDGEYLVVSVEHRGSNNYFERDTRQPYRNSFSALRKSVNFRPARVTPRPVMRGPQSATVVVKDGEDIDCDKYGRIRVQFHWDREGKFNEQSSCWVRLAMPWAGENFGFITLPRKGQEVLVDFLEGDPDLPIIVGSIYNETHKPPWDLPENKTQSGILTRSTKNGTKANANALRFEDKKNHEEVWLHAERNQRIEVEADESHSVGHDRTKTIGHDETTKVSHDRTETVINNESITIGVNRTEVVGQNEMVTVGLNRTMTIGVNESLTVGGSQTNTVALQRTDTIGANFTETVGMAKETAIGVAYVLAVGAGMTTTVGADLAEDVGVEKTVNVGTKYAITAGTELVITVGASTVKLDAAGKISISGTDITLSAGAGSININPGGIVSIKGTMVDIKGMMVKINT